MLIDYPLYCESEVLPGLLVYRNLKVSIFEVYANGPHTWLHSRLYCMGGLHCKLVVVKVIVEGGQVRNRPPSSVLLWGNKDVIVKPRSVGILYYFDCSLVQHLQN
jgi:hypothetical protein